MTPALAVQAKNTNNVMAKYKAPCQTDSMRQHVVIGLIVNARNQVLMAERAQHKHLGGLWEFPGGKVETNEKAVLALQRELHEELGITVRQASPVMEFPYHYPEKDVLLDVWQVSHYKGQVTGAEGQKIYWCPITDLHSMDYPPASHRIVMYLIENKEKLVPSR